MEILFWSSLVLLAYPYLGYPALMAVAALVLRRDVRRSPIEPRVTVLVPAYNEAESISETIAHLLGQDYPRGKLQILVVSDGSTDGTDEIVRGFANRGIELLRQENRGGKALALNAAVRVAQGEILVFCDANARFEPDAVRQLVQNFADPTVGYVTGQLRLVSASGSLSGAGNNAYVRFENAIRTVETRVGSIIGVNGGIDATRRELYSDIPGELITDFVLPLRIIARGHRVVYDPQARSTEVANAELRSEFRMRVRVALRALQGLMHMNELFNPVRHPLTSFCLTSHKLLRYVGFAFLGTAAITNLWLAIRSPAYLGVLGFQAGCYVLAFLGIRGFGGSALRRLTTVPAYLLVTYAAFASAFFKFVRGQTMATWQPRAG
jgi:cellulose synthase/poly-beta-1,6-N-acetylglucosamine synthase-like glycosyltransferase